MVDVGKQKEGRSSKPVYEMALRSVQEKDISADSILDVGGGAGRLSKKLIEMGAQDITLLDHDPATHPEVVDEKECDLNNRWPVENEKYDRVFAVEVIEHLENPRFLFREAKRVMKSGGKAFVSTPNNESFFSRLNFFLTGEHRYFQDSCYPSHISPVLSVDFERICDEVGLDIVDVIYSGHEVIPKVGVSFSGGGKLFSANFGVLIEK